MEPTTTNPDTGYRSITVPCDSEQGAFLIERLQGTRISIRIGKTVLFLTYNEAAQLIEAIPSLMGLSITQPTLKVKL